VVIAAAPNSLQGAGAIQPRQHARLGERVELWFAAIEGAAAWTLRPEADLPTSKKTASKIKSPGSIHIEPRLAFVCSKLV